MTIPLSGIRRALGISAEDFSSQLDMKYTTYANIEAGRRTTYTRALKIQHGINKLRVEKGESVVTLEDLGINIA